MNNKKLALQDGATLWSTDGIVISAFYSKMHFCQLFL